MKTNELIESVLGYALALLIGTGMAAAMVVWWSAA